MNGQGANRKGNFCIVCGTHYDANSMGFGYCSTCFEKLTHNRTHIVIFDPENTFISNGHIDPAEVKLEGMYLDIMNSAFRKVLPDVERSALGKIKGGVIYMSYEALVEFFSAVILTDPSRESYMRLAAAKFGDAYEDDREFYSYLTLTIARGCRKVVSPYATLAEVNYPEEIKHSTGLL